MRAVAAIVVLGFAASAAAEGIEPGLWRFTTTVSGSGMAPRTETSTRCIGPDEARDPTRAMRAGPQGRCDSSSKRGNDKMVEWQMTCVQPGASATATMRYGRDSMEGEFNLEEIQGAAGALPTSRFELRSRLSATRLGPCKN